jgi:uncharacterized protein (TIGR02145 family)
MKMKYLNLCLLLVFFFCNVSFSQSDSTGTVTDIDGNVYQTVKIGDQWWMAENLKVTRYQNGDSIPNVTEYTQWTNLTTGAYCNFNNDTTNVSTYGRLYNWYVVADSRKIAPPGWHVPNDEEWKELEMHLGMSQSVADSIGYRGTDEGGKLKEADTTHWISPNIGATNGSGFSALPGGLRKVGGMGGSFINMGYEASYWSSTDSSTDSWFRNLVNHTSDIGRHITGKQLGFSVRCIKEVQQQ